MLDMYTAVKRLTRVLFPQATELFLRAVQEEQNGAVYEGTYVGSKSPVK